MNREERELTMGELNLVAGGKEMVLGSGYCGGISWEVTPSGTQIHWAGDGCVYTMSSSGGFGQRC